jgi:putative DNA primase/helicase
MQEKFGRFNLELLADSMVQGAYRNPTKTEDVAAMLLNSLHFARNKEDDLYLYDEGIYRLVDKNVRQCCEAIYSKYSIKWTSTKVNEVERYITDNVRVHLLPLKPKEGMINLKNGIYFIDEKKFELHKESDHWKYLNTIQIPIIYDPAATCPQIMKFMDEVFPGGGNLLVDVIGICMTTSTANHKAIILLGEGNNGKSAYLYCLRAAVGRENVSSTSIHKLADTTERFANNDIVGKLVNATDDVAQGKILDTSNVKSIVSGNEIRAEGKFRMPVTYLPFCKLIFGANHRLESNDESMGYMRRIMHIPFAQTFALNPAKEKQLHAVFDNPTELSGLFNEIAKRLTETVANGFIIPEEVHELVDNFDPIPDLIKNYIMQHMVEDKDGVVPVREFYMILNTSLSENFETMDNVIKYVKHVFRNVKISRPRINGKQVKCFMGVSVDEFTKMWMSRALPEGTVISEIEYLEQEI